MLLFALKLKLSVLKLLHYLGLVPLEFVHSLFGFLLLGLFAASKLQHILLYSFSVLHKLIDLFLEGLLLYL